MSIEPIHGAGSNIPPEISPITGPSGTPQAAFSLSTPSSTNWVTSFNATYNLVNQIIANPADSQNLTSQLLSQIAILTNTQVPLDQNQGLQNSLTTEISMLQDATLSDPSGGISACIGALTVLISNLQNQLNPPSATLPANVQSMVNNITDYVGQICANPQIAQSIFPQYQGVVQSLCQNQTWQSLSTAQIWVLQNQVSNWLSSLSIVTADDPNNQYLCNTPLYNLNNQLINVIAKANLQLK